MSNHSLENEERLQPVSSKMLIKEAQKSSEKSSDDSLQPLAAIIQCNLNKIGSLIFNEQEKEDIKKRLQEHLSSLKEWNPHYDFHLWDKVELYFNSIWRGLHRDVHLAMEYDLYMEVRDLFFEMRHLLQWTGRIGERIYIATWLRRAAERYGDFGTKYIALSSLAWSYTSSSCYKNIEKARSLWEELSSNLVETNRPLGFDAFGNDIRVSLELPMYAELLMDAHENGVRIGIRHGDLEQAEKMILKGERLVEELFVNLIIKSRLRSRFLATFKYHRGIIHYLNDDYPQSEKYFQSVIEQAELIQWDRVLKGAKSWLATLAVKCKQYDESERILADIFSSSSSVDKRDAFCHLIKEQLCHKQGNPSQGEVYRIEAHKVFAYYTDNRENYDLDTYTLM
jgi:hypothetical protein